MTRTIYLRTNGRIIEMTQTPYDSEDLFQGLLAESQELLPGDLIDPQSPRRWLLVAREIGIPDQEERSGRWSLDHLFLDQDGTPTFVEVKRSSDTRLRREVVGQMLDYAANATVYWPADFIREQFEVWCDAGARDPAQVLDEFLNGEMTEERFWDAVHTNLLAGKIRLMFVADVIPPELQRIIEFLNERMDPTEVLGVEVRQYVGGGMQSFIPQVIGRTAEAQATKSSSRSSMQWDEESFFLDLAERRGDSDVQVAAQILEWARRRGVDAWWGRGRTHASVVLRLLYQGDKHFAFALKSFGAIELYFRYIANSEPFAPEERRQTLLNRLNAIQGIEVPSDGIDGMPKIDLAVLAEEDRLRQFLDVWDWYLAEVRAYYAG